MRLQGRERASGICVHLSECERGREAYAHLDSSGTSVGSVCFVPQVCRGDMLGLQGGYMLGL